MAIKKKVAVAISAAKAPVKEAEPVSDIDDVFNVSNDSPSQETKKEYETFMGKDRLVRYAKITWNPKYKGKSLRFVIYADDSCPEAMFGSLADLEYLQKKYPMEKQYFISDNLCKNGRHRFVVYKIHALSVVDTVEQEDLCSA